MKSIFTDDVINDLNIISSYLAIRDIDKLNETSLFNNYKIKKADLIILLGNSMLYSAEIAAKAIENNLADKLLISGGIGHSTQYLINSTKKFDSENIIETNEKSEAEILKQIIIKYYKIDEEKIITESDSTNCGMNAEFSFKIIKKEKIDPQNIILIQDPTMQNRIFASFIKHWGTEYNFINFAPIIPVLKIKKNKLTYENENITGIWKIERFLSLLMGEIPRLIDNENGYGPKGKNFIVHVDVPNEIINSYERLKPILGAFWEKRNI
jgi:uncharacterized SAM-binding protein YcdF (DUF218 family)